MFIAKLISLLASVSAFLPGVAPESSMPSVAWAPGRDVYEGDTIQLECQVGLEVEAPAIWVKLDPLRPNSDEIISHGVLLIAEDPRLSVERLSDSNTFVLAIREVSAADAGRYQCQVPVSSNQTELRTAPPITISLKRAAAAPAASSGEGTRLSPLLVSLAMARCLLLLHKRLVCR
ncbi:lachesin [Hyalella azteca]|uniref:Lachesin n=1 Tax=Hyalella azteca TaxID=294128 RepID=A0A8B7NVQ9_HYAAZ|nr:lachesin [Hyalella azteca]